MLIRFLESLFMSAKTSNTLLGLSLLKNSSTLCWKVALLEMLFRLKMLRLAPTFSISFSIVEYMAEYVYTIKLKPCSGLKNGSVLQVSK